MVFALWITTLVSRPVFITGGFIGAGKATGYAFDFHGVPPDFGHRKSPESNCCQSLGYFR
jgi:hypothetical protein